LGILKNLPKSFEATRYHSLIIDKKTLSKHLEITAESKDGLVMGVQHKKYNVHGVQFHPESIKTKLGIKILKNLPKSFEATRYHSLIIEKKSLSKNLEITAETKDGLVMGVQHKKYNVHGVQFHPESIKTKLGIKILKNFIRI
jgi:anthranilate/para-aminobenzoate synthase component II